LSIKRGKAKDLAQEAASFVELYFADHKAELRITIAPGVRHYNTVRGSKIGGN
jgi:hypothetical protein